MYRCRICGGEWTEIPPDAIEIASKRRGVLYQFGGTVHDLRQHKPMSIEEHKHKHRKTPRSNCRFCNPLTWAAEQTKLLQEVAGHSRGAHSASPATISTAAIGQQKEAI